MGALKLVKTTFDDELDPLHLAEVIKAFFENGRGAPLARFRDRSAEFYSGLSIDERGDRWLAPDRAALSTLFDLASGRLPASAPEKRLLIVGSGPGRLMDDIGAYAKRNGFTEVVVNDINPAFVTTAARVLADSTRGKAIRIVEAPGDAATLRLESKADLALAWFFVSAEICDIESVEALRTTRYAYYKAITENLVEGGCFIEDMPERHLPGFYATLAKRSRAILMDNRLMGDAAEVLALSYVPRTDGSLPYHIRCMPTASWREMELAEAGFAHIMSWCDQADAHPGEYPLPIDRRRIKRIELLRKVPSREKRRIVQSRALFARLVHPTIAPPVEVL